MGKLRSKEMHFLGRNGAKGNPAHTPWADPQYAEHTI